MDSKYLLEVEATWGFRLQLLEDERELLTLLMKVLGPLMFTLKSSDKTAFTQMEKRNPHFCTNGYFRA